MMTAIETKNNILLSYLLAELADVPAHLDLPVFGISNDSRTVEPGFLFAGCHCHYNNSIDFVRDAIDKGATAIIYEAGCLQSVKDISVTTFDVKDLHKKLGTIAGRYFGSPSEKMSIVGVTGTNGKTSVSHLLAQAFNLNDEKCGLIGTLGFGVFDHLQDSANTTPMPIDLHSILAEFHGQGMDKAVLEVSSHGLDQYRISGVNIETAVFTNLSRDHLDYHADMNAYANAKLKLFTEYTISNAVINIDDPFSNQLINSVNDKVRKILYSMDRKQLELQKFKYDEFLCGEITESRLNRIKLRINSSWGDDVVESNLTGEFNAYNILSCIGVLCSSGIAFDTALKLITRLNPIPGRLELFSKHGFPNVFVDYAHTPDALEKVLITLKKQCKGKLICIFGCGGERDTGKRKLMGKVASSYADIIVLTNDNPRNEEQENIIRDILQGIDDSRELKIEYDRSKAIRQFIGESNEDDFILIAGKGHENYQDISGNKIRFSDQNVVRQILGSIND